MYSVRKIARNFKSRIPDVPVSVILVLVICLVGIGAFSLGWVARGNADSPPIQTQKLNLSGVGAVGLYVGSKNSDRYHYRWCSGADRINPDNKLFFRSAEQAESAGYKPADNCKGLK